MNIRNIPKSEILRFLYEKNVLTKEEVKFHLENTPKNEVENLFVKFLNKK